jgi:serpin B
VRLACSRYGAAPARVEFASGAAAKEINGWISKLTRGRVPSLVGGLAPETPMVVASAIYFRANWDNAFEASETRRSTFHAPEGDQKAWLMHTVDEEGYARISGAKLLRRRYQGGAELVVILPDAVSGLPELERRLPAELGTWLGKLTDRQVDVALPRFTTRARLEDLGAALSAMGMARAFAPDADFGALGPQVNLRQVIHEAFISVDEHGTEAAAASAVMYGVGDMDESKPAVFRADHPFLYLVRDPGTGAILFLGRLEHLE